MTYYQDPLFISALKKDPKQRNTKDLETIYIHLRNLSSTHNLKESELSSICKSGYFIQKDANDILFRRGDLVTNWYILLVGSVYIDDIMFLPPSSIGNRYARGLRHSSECLVLEPSEMIVIEYPDSQVVKHISHHSEVCKNIEKNEIPDKHPYSWLKFYDYSDTDNAYYDNIYYSHFRHECDPLYERKSRNSDTSSAYSGSDTVGSSLEADEIDLTGLEEGNVDSDEDEDLAESMESLSVRDEVRDCLDKDPSQRTEDDINVLLDFIQHLRAFANMTSSVRRALCSVMVFAVVQKAGMIVMNNGEELDSWSVIVNGQVEIELPNGQIQEFGVGDSFGITPTIEKLYHVGIMRTKVDDCQFLCITQSDYYRILNFGEESIIKILENDVIVLKMEERVIDTSGKKGTVVIQVSINLEVIWSHFVFQGTPEKLLQQLVQSEATNIDPNFVEDFLLTYRTFMQSAVVLITKLLSWFHEQHLRDKVTRILLLWVNNHFTDFETDAQMMSYLESFGILLEKEHMYSQLRLLNLAYCTKARTRIITFTRSSREEPLRFSIVGGSIDASASKKSGIYVSSVDTGSKEEALGLRRGDQILELNGQNFDHISHSRVLELVRGNTHICLTVKSNLLGLKESLEQSTNPVKMNARRNSDSIFTRLQESQMNSDPVLLPSHVKHRKEKWSYRRKDLVSQKGSLTLGHKTRLRKAIEKVNHLTKHIMNDPYFITNSSSETLLHQNTNCDSFYQNHFNSDINAFSEEFGTCDFPDHVLKVYRADQSFKYLPVHKETTSHEIVMLALTEFGITDPSSCYSLCEVTVTEEGIIKQRKLPEQLRGLAEHLMLGSRYYLRNNSSSEPLVPDDLASELAKENQVSLLQLNSQEIAIQLTLQDYHIFSHIEATEYVDDLFGLNSKYGTPQLEQFSQLVNREMFWVVSEIVQEHSLMRRMRLIKQFIKIARHCKECRNFNSMFAILSGLGHEAVARLKLTWEKVPGKYTKLFSDMQELMDPSRNMSKYRHLIGRVTNFPLIPFWPIVMKDLTFIHLGNDTIIDGLVNFEKLRMVAKEIRSLISMASGSPELFILGDSVLHSSVLPISNLGTGSITLKRKRKGFNLITAKKMFEEGQMVRKVKAYILKLKIITEEEMLRTKSLECESSPNTLNAPRRAHPSPTLSTTSSNSSTSEGVRTKFGAHSPQSLQKLLALSEPSKTRPYQPRKHSSVVNIPRSPQLSPKIGYHILGIVSHERSHSDTGTLPVDLCLESSSVTSFRKLPPIRRFCDPVTNDAQKSVHSSIYHIDNQLCSNKRHSIEIASSPDIKDS